MVKENNEMKMIEIKNNLGRPVIFRVPGSSIRLGPGESVSLPEAYTESPELEQLLRKQALRAIPVPEPTESTAGNPAKQKPAKKSGKRQISKSKKKTNNPT